ncbi:PmoA family protein [Siccationidurans ginsengisoli]|nr:MULTISPECIES: PmoA family protein [unclassified Hymenobacter]MBO2033370.1 PmoA family protein [Hymenobacter sp. BT559]
MTKLALPGSGALVLTLACLSGALAQKPAPVRVAKDATAKKIDVFVGNKLFTSFLYPDSLEKPVLYPLRAAGGTVVTRGFPLHPQPGDPTDHPHHIGLWFNYENVNGLDFWNNSYAIPKEKKGSYGWIKTDKILTTSSGPVGVLAYHANWTNQQNQVLLEETTRFEFSGTDRARTIDRVTTLKAVTDVAFNDAKDGLLGLRLAHELQLPTDQDQKFTDSKGIVTVVKAGTDHVANGNYLTSAGKRGNDAWSTRGTWCKVYGKMGADSVSIAIIDHPQNPNYPTFWHARGYGLFAANPLGEKVFTNGAAAKNLHLKKGESVTFRYRILIDEGSRTLSPQALNEAAADFAKRSMHALR